jgi:ketosteroid isomerase-like protein
MSEQTVDVVRRFYTEYRGEYDRFRRDPGGLFAFFDPDVEWHPLTGSLVEGVPYRGHDGVRQYFEDLAESWELSWVVADRYLDAGDSVVVFGRIHGRGRASELEMEIPAAWVWKVRDGLVTYMHVYTHESEALEAAGLE